MANRGLVKRMPNPTALRRHEAIANHIAPRRQRAQARTDIAAAEYVERDIDENLLRRAADIAVRMVRPRQKALVARRVGKSPVGLYAHRACVERLGLPKAIGDLESHCDRLRPQRPAAEEPSAQKSWPDAAAPDASCSPFAAATTWRNMPALKCVGIGGCQHGVARNYPELVAALAKVIRFELDMWVVMHENMRSTARIRRLFDHLDAELSILLRG